MPPKRVESDRVGGQLAAQFRQGLGEQAGDVHLGDADLFGDLALGQVAVEAEGEDFLLAFVEGGEGGAEGDAGFGDFEFVVFAAEGFAEFGGAVGADGGGEAGGVVGAGAFEAFEDFFFGDAEVGGDVGDLGGAAEGVGECGVGLGDGEAEFLEAAGDADGPGAVAEVAFDLRSSVGSPRPE
jgi:hypothetical protein